MSVFYVDLENGDNANDGTTWANAWKTALDEGPSATRITAGDEIRISKSPDPVSIGSATWLADGNYITLASARTKFIWDGDDAWTLSANMNSNYRTTTSSYTKFVAGIYRLYPSSAFTTGLMAYITLPSTLDLSAFQELTFWLKPSTTINSGTIRIALCSDSAGATVVDNFALTEQRGSYSRPQVIKKTGGGNLGSSINSLAIYADSDPSTVQMYFSMFTACKTDDLNFLSLVGKDSSAQNADCFYPVMAVDTNNVSVYIDSFYSAKPSSVRGYGYASGETITTYMRQPIILPQSLQTNGTCFIETDESGTEDNLIKYSGGWEVGTTNQNGETHVTPCNSYGYGVYVLHSFIEIEKVGVSRAYCGFYFTNYIGIKANLRNIVACFTGVEIGGIGGEFTFMHISCNGAGVKFVGMQDSIINEIKITDGYVLFESSTNNHLKASNIQQTNGAIWFENSSNNRVTGTLNQYGYCGNVFIVHPFSGDNYAYDCIVRAIYDEGLISMGSTSYTGMAKLLCENLRFITTNGPSDNTYKLAEVQNYSRAYLIETDQHGTDPYAYQIKIGHTYRSIAFPHRLQIAKFAFLASKEVTITAWVKRELFVNARIRVQDSPSISLTEQTAVCSTSSTDYQQLEINFTPSEAGVAALFFDAWSLGIGYNAVYLSSFEITQAD